MCRLLDGGRAASFEHPPSKRIMRNSRILFEVIVLVAPWKEASPRSWEGAVALSMLSVRRTSHNHCMTAQAIAIQQNKGAGHPTARPGGMWLARTDQN
jgi:hypothetical protein